MNNRALLAELDARTPELRMWMASLEHVPRIDEGRWLSEAKRHMETMLYMLRVAMERTEDQR